MSVTSSEIPASSKGRNGVVWIREGCDPNFSVVQSPPPTYFIEITTLYPTGVTPVDTVTTFAESDVFFAIVRGGFEEIKNKMIEVAHDPQVIHGHIDQYCCAGLYAIWDLGDHQMIAGVDQALGSSDTACSAVEHLALSMDCVISLNGIEAQFFSFERKNFNNKIFERYDFLDTYEALQNKYDIMKQVSNTGIDATQRKM